MKNRQVLLFEDVGLGMIACGVGVAVVPHITHLRRPTEPSEQGRVPRHRSIERQDMESVSCRAWQPEPSLQPA
jgi:hypothetical protein